MTASSAALMRAGHLAGSCCFPCRYTFHVPANDQNWHWGFHSCSGFSLSVKTEDWGGVAPLWRDVLTQHASAPIHVMCGGGDQLYNDALFKVGDGTI